ncbi:MAG: hypothetical protein JWO73_513 [Candidatus Taylorbacteria bacterium]|nr:hypothetical protein [Candidatus Taylorbacteria bacterium]
MRKKCIFLAAAILILAGVYLISASGASVRAVVPLESVLIADTQALKELGLGRRDSLDQRTGMLFIFDQPGRHGFWMKDMRFPIDIVWLDENLIVTHVEENISPATYDSAKPSASKIFDPEQKSSFVLEVSAGIARKNNYTEGNSLGFLRQYIYTK